MSEPLKVNDRRASVIDEDEARARESAPRPGGNGLLGKAPPPGGPSAPPRPAPPAAESPRQASPARPTASAPGGASAISRDDPGDADGEADWPPLESDEPGPERGGPPPRGGRAVSGDEAMQITQQVLLSLPGAKFTGFVIENALSRALIALGRMPHPLTGAIQRKLDEARIFIDLISAIAQANKGRWPNPLAERQLESALSELRLQYARLAPSGGAK